MVGRSFATCKTVNSWCSDGKFTRDEEYTYTVCEDKCIKVDYKYHDDDGQNGSESWYISDVREILPMLYRFC